MATLRHVGFTTLIGREAELAAVEHALARPAPDAPPLGAVISGPAGVGKTALARAARALAEARSLPTLWLAATPAARGVPFAVLAGMETGGDADEEASMSLGTARRVLLDLAADTGLVVIVDDAQHLDGPTALALWQLVGDGRITVVATVRHGEPLPEEILALWAAGPAVRIELRPLDRGAVADLCEEVLGAPVDPVLSAEVARLTGGLPLFVRELLLGAAAEGVIAPSPATWRLVRALDVPPRVADLVEARLAALGGSAREALELVVLAEPLPMGWMLEAHDEEVVQRLVDAQFVEVRTEEARPPVLRLAHPLSGEALSAAMPDVRRRRHLEFLAAHIDPARSTVADRARAVRWALATDKPVEPGMVTQAAADLVAVGDYRNAMDLAEIAWRDAPGVMSGQLLGFVATACGAGRRAEEVFVAALEHATDDEARVMLTIGRTENLSSTLLRTAEALAVCRAEGLEIEAPVWKSLLSAQRAALELSQGDGRSAFATLAPLLEHDDPRVYAFASCWAAVGFAYDGRPDDALEHAQRAYAIHSELRHELRFPFEPEAHLIRVVYGLLYGGRLDEADAVSGQLFDMSLALGIPMAIPLTSLARGLVDAERGRLADASAWFARSAHYFGSFGLGSLRPWPLGSLLRVLARGGHMDEARAVIEELDRPSSLRFNETIALTGRAWVAWRDGRVQDARAALLDAADWAVDCANRTNAVLALHDLAVLGFATDAVDRAAALVDEVQGPLLGAKLGFVVAAAVEDPDGLAAVGDRLATMGAWLAAAEAYGSAAAASARRGGAQRAAQLEFRAREAAAATNGASVETLAELAATPALTSREREVAHLAAAGLASKRIADDLGITRKTVDNLLARAYSKLGVNSRADLAELLGSGGPVSR